MMEWHVTTELVSVFFFAAVHKRVACLSIAPGNVDMAEISPGQERFAGNSFSTDAQSRPLRFPNIIQRPNGGGTTNF